MKRKNWASNPIDVFVLARLEDEGLTPSVEADRVTLIRRLHLDLLGLPPTPAEVAAFVDDARPDAFERLVDRLLASPNFGERWGRHWLDLARYADSDGYEDDLYRPDAWRFRDWVIQSINKDVPFDQFTLEQLAGDLLPNSTYQQKVATGFHRMAPMVIRSLIITSPCASFPFLPSGFVTFLTRSSRLLGIWVPKKFEKSEFLSPRVPDWTIFRDIFFRF